MTKTVSIVDYSMGNILSVSRMVERLGLNCEIVNSKEGILKAKHLILPGVGHFGRAMDVLREKEWEKVLTEAVMEKQTPIVGICLGMQLMTKGSEEGNVEGLGWFDTQVTKINVDDPLRYKVPHMGWNVLEANQNHPSVKKLNPLDRFYFVHSYQVADALPQDILTYTTYEKRFVSSLAKGSIIGFQFHPEKSQDAGFSLLESTLQ
ncbi:MAG: imidazole glycerol phosphate synthase subunit HisH [Bacteroidota bacterium]